MTTEKNLIRSAEVYVDELKLYSNNGVELNLLPIFHEFSYYESVFGDFVSANVTLIDTKSILTHAPIIGQEVVIISFSTPTMPKIRKVFSVYSVSHRVMDTQTNKQTYRLNLLAPEAFLNMKQKVNKAYDDTYSNTARKIFNEYLAIDNKFIKSELFYEETAGGSPVVIPHWSPTNTINFIGKKSISKDNPNHASFLFYQDADQFNFVSIGRLMESAVHGKYAYNTKNTRSNPNSTIDPADEMTKITNFEILDTPDRQIELLNGVYASRLYSTDVVRKKYEVLHFNGNAFWDYTNHLGDFPPYPRKGENLTTNTESYNMYLPKHTNLFGGDDGENRGDYNKPERWALQGNFARQSLMSICIRITVPGDSTLRAGKRIFVEFPIMEFPEQGKPWYDEYYTGHYLVTSLRHIVNRNSYYCVLECHRDGVNKPYDDVRAINISKR